MKEINVFDMDSIGYLGDNQRWWFDTEHPDSFEYFDLNAFYPDKYFEENHGMTSLDVDNLFLEVKI